jgi:hypothetical protein
MNPQRVAYNRMSAAVARMSPDIVKWVRLSRGTVWISYCTGFALQAAMQADRVNCGLV